MAEEGDEEKEMAEAEELAPVEKHDPFSVAILKMAKQAQSQNGLRHNDHLRYRQYCARRLRRVRNALRHKHGRGRFKAAPVPDDFNDIRFLELPMVNAERAWSYAVQLKADNATAAVPNPRFRLHSIRRFRKAAMWAQTLHKVCENHCDQRTVLEAEGYQAWHEANWYLEKEDWAEALARLKRCEKVYEHLGLASQGEDSEMYKAHIQLLAPSLRECKYHLGDDAEEDDEDDSSAKPSGKAGKKDKGSKTGKDASDAMKYRGKGFAIPSDKIKSDLRKCLDMTKAIKTDSSEESSVVIEKYGELSTAFSEALHQIHSEMIEAGSEGQGTDWKFLEGYARELHVTMNLERNLVLMELLNDKMDALSDITSSDSRKVCRPEEGMRFCDLLKGDIESLQDLPETTDEINHHLEAYLAFVMDCRCFFLALCNLTAGKQLEAAALLDMLRGRVDRGDLGKPLADPLGRLHPFFQRFGEELPRRVTCWWCRILTQLARGTEAGADESTQKNPLLDLTNIATFPPKVTDITCKPLLFDLAFPCITAPDLEQYMPKKEEDKKKGLLRSVTGSALGKIGGWFGKK